MRGRLLFGALTLLLTVVGCAARPESRAEYGGLPQLEGGWSRMYISAGTMNGVRLWSVHQVGPVLVNNHKVGSTAKDEHLVVDLLPGTYEASCAPEQPEKNFADKRQFTFRAGETRYFACDMENKGVGLYFGLIGAIASDYLTQTFLEERPLDNPNSKLVSYKKIQ